MGPFQFRIFCDSILCLLGGVPHCPQGRGQTICNTSVLICPAEPHCLPLALVIRQSKRSAVGSGSAADSLIMLDKHV